MTLLSLLMILVRWSHLLFGIAWIGMLYYFNFVQGGYFKAATPEALKDAKAKLDDEINRRQALAERKIASAEAAATAEVKAAAAELAAQVSANILQSRLAGLKSDPLIDSAVSQMASKLQ